MSGKLLVVFLFSLLLVACASAAKQPHIVHILVDDLGWAEVGYHNKAARAVGDVRTPNLDQLAKEGLELDRFYAEKICSPSRCSLLTGRHAIHVNVQNVLPEMSNPEDTDGGYQGVAVNMTSVATKLKDVGYTTRLIGKWDMGMATEQHSPASRGFDSWLGYWHHSNDYWTQDIEQCGFNNPVKDLWRSNATFSGPERTLVNGPSCTQDNQEPEGETCRYEDDIFADEVGGIIAAHHPSSPLFLVYSMHLVHMPLQVQQAKLDEFGSVDNPYRQQMHAMVSQMDIYVGAVVDSLKTAGLWEDTLLVLHSDNGGEIMTPFCGGNNYPLRGGKFSNFEGGVRVVAMVSGGFLPEHRRGQVESGLVSVADWFATYAAVGGVPPEQVPDFSAAAAGLPPIDSVNCWPLLANAQTCRSEIPLGDTSALGFNMDGNALVGGLVQERYKLLLGAENKGFHVDQDVITGVFWPNNTDVLIPELHPRVCGRDPANGCLFDLQTDPGEYESLATQLPEVFAEMLARLDEVQGTVYSPDRGTINKAACEQVKTNEGYWGPFIEV